MALTKSEIKQLRHRTEDSRFILSLFILVPMAIFLVLAVIFSFGIALIVIAFLVLIVWFVHSLIFAVYFANLVKVSENSFPRVQAAIDEAKELFGFEGKIDAYIFAGGGYNVFLHYLMRHKVLLISSEVLIEEDKNEEMRFLVGRFVGALVGKHYRFGWLKFFIDTLENAALFNFFLYPYERAVQYSGDNMGLYFIGGNANVASNALIKTQVGREVIDQVNIHAYLDQADIAHSSIFVLIARLLSPFPHTTHRVANIFRQSQGQAIWPGLNSGSQFSLKIESGTQAGYSLPVDRNPFCIGRDSEWSDLLLSTDENISRQHCQIRNTHNGVEIRDLGSSNGTFVNNKILSAGTWVGLNAGDIVEVADVKIRLNRNSA